MPKPIPVERFKLSCEVEATHLGPTLAALTKMGLTNLGFELITDVRRYAQKNAGGVSATELLAKFIEDHPTFKAGEAVQYFDANGSGKNSAYPALTTAVNSGILKKLGPGMYARADMKHLAGPNKKAKRPTTAKGVVARNKYATNNTDFILRTARRNHGRFNSMSIKKLFEADGRSQTSVGPAINVLLKRKMAKRVGEGEYVLLTKAAPKAKAVKEAIVNGSGAPVEVTANG